MRGGRRALRVAVLAVLAAACTGRGETAPPQTRPLCEIGFSPPSGFSPAGSDEIPQEGWIAVRMSFRDDQGHTLHLTSGLAGEFGEGMPFRRIISLADGSDARLIGEATSWLVAWETDPPCTERTIGGIGFGRNGFLRLLRAIGAA